jgi:cell shape-determining protein MreC
MATSQAISAYAEPEKLVGPQLNYIVSKEKVREIYQERRQGVTTGLSSLQSLVYNATNFVTNIKKQCISFYEYLKNSYYMTDAKRAELEELQEEEKLMEDEEYKVDGEYDATTITSVVKLAEKTRDVRHLPNPSSSDDVVPF